MLVIDGDGGAWWWVVAGEEQSSLAFSGCHNAGDGMTAPPLSNPHTTTDSGLAAYGGIPGPDAGTFDHPGMDDAQRRTVFPPCNLLPIPAPVAIIWW
ncbi:hypothetical protein HFU75_01610 [Acidithiobacillus sp. VAN18-2]|nr:hypothetical protein [Acidithiobacillus sp. VAN18-2]